MAFIEAVVLKEPHEVNRRLAELELDPEILLKVRAIALNAAADATPFHPANAPGTFAYHHGTWALRDGFIVPNSNWRLDRSNGLEAIANDKIQVMVIFANVDVACNDEQKPKPRSQKGAGSERACSGNLLFDKLPEYAPAQTGWATYYLMVSESGAAELTMPVVKGGTFTAWPERIYLSDGSDFDPTVLNLDNGDTVDNFDPQVVRK